MKVTSGLMRHLQLSVPTVAVLALTPDASLGADIDAAAKTAPIPTAAAAHDATEKVKGDMEPVDPAEQRMQMMPPERPSVRAGSAWVWRGPSATQGAQGNVPPNNQATGAINAIAPHPSNANVLYIGAVNGGVWRAANATAAQPTWTPLTDSMRSLSIGALALDPLDASQQTMIAGTGRLSNFAQLGDDEIGVYRTIKGGDSWTTLGSATLLGQKWVAVAAHVPIGMAASRNGGLFGTGTVFTLTSDTNGLPTGGIFNLVGDRTHNARFSIAVAGATPKVLRSDNSGANWTDNPASSPFEEVQ